MGHFDLHSTFGAATLSSFISAGLFGFTFLQTYSYFIHCSGNDGVLRKLGVCFLWVFDGLQVVFLVWAIYHYLVQNFFFPTALLDEDWTIPAMWLMSLAGNLLAEAYFASHIWTLSKRNVPLTAFIIVAALGQAAASAVVFRHMVARFIGVARFTTKSNLLPVSLQQIFASIGNAAVAVALCHFNYDASIGLSSALSTVNGFLTFVIDRAVLCVIFQVVYLAIYVAHDKTFLWLPFHVTSSKLLVNALLAQLNGRECKTRRGPGSFGLSQLDAHASVHINEQVKTVTDGDTHSTPAASTRKVNLDEHDLNQASAVAQQ